MKILLIIGARPQFIKISPIIEELRIRGVDFAVLHTNQHFDFEMSEVFARDFGYKINFILPKLSTPALPWIHKKTLEISEILKNENFTHSLVIGDTNTTLAGALASKNCGVFCVHVEAGLRSGDFKMPEEIIRRLCDASCDALFAPTKTAVLNLSRENLHKNIVINTGDVNLDAFLRYENFAREPKIFQDLSHNFVIFSVHRASNSTENFMFFLNLAKIFSRKIQILFLVHPKFQNLTPRSEKNLIFHAPLPYFEMLFLLKRCAFVASDSGGLCKEAFFARKFCLILRENTEYPELLAQNFAKLFLSDFLTPDVKTPEIPIKTPQKIFDMADFSRAEHNFSEILRHDFFYDNFTSPPPIFGTGRAAVLIVKILKNLS